MNASPRCTLCARPGIGLIAVVIMCFVGAVQAQRPGEKSRRVDSPLRVAETQAGEFVTRLILDDAVYREVKSSDRITIANFALDPQRRVDLELERIEVFAGDAKIVRGTLGDDVPMPRPDVVILGGHIKGQPDSHVFLSLSPHGNNGLIETGTETFVIANRRGQAESDTVIYNANTLPDGAITWADWKCGTVMPPVLPGGPAAAATAQDMVYSASSAATSRRATMAIEADFEYTDSVFGGDSGASAAYAATLVGAVSEIYSRDLDTRLEIGYLRLWTVSTDPYTATTRLGQLDEFRDYWNANMTGTPRNAAHLLSGRGMVEGGYAYIPGLCRSGWDYAVSGGLNGSFPYPVQNHHLQNWDLFIVAHELGHNFGAWHTHAVTPQIDGCGTGDCSAAYGGTIMSYCGDCAPGFRTNIDLRFHERIIAETIMPYITGVSCDLSAPPSDCTVVGPPSVGIVSHTNRTLSVVGGNPGAFSGLRVTISGHLPPFHVLNGTEWWVGTTQVVSENGGKADPAEAPPGTPTYRAATLRCEPYFTDWGSLGTTHVSHEVVLPGGTYTVEEILGACPQSEPSNWSSPLTLITSNYGDVVGDCANDPCTPPDGNIDVTTDVTAVLNKFKNLAGAPIKARADVEPAVPDYVINISDVTYALSAFRGFAYPFPVPTVTCP